MTHTVAVSIAVVVGVLLFIAVYIGVRSRFPASMVPAIIGGLVVGVAGAVVTSVFLNPAPRTEAITLTTCPNHNFTDSLLKDPLGNTREVFTSVSYGDIPEFHDCQKLITPGPGGAGEYGPTVAIFATTLGSAAPTHTNPVVAVVWTVGGGYPALGIQMQPGQQYGINCLYLFDSSVGQNAKMVGPVSQDVKCSDATITNQAGTPLWVLASSPNSDVPAVARWDYDSSAKLNYVGIKCGDAWCEIGRDNSIKVSSIMTPSAVTNSALAPVLSVKGWYDQQLLADPVGSGLKISDVTGTLIPAPGLGALVDSNFVSFREVATAIVDKPYKMDLEPGENTVSLCKGDLVTCAQGDPSVGGPPTRNPGGWWARIKSVSASGLAKTTYHCVIYTEHTTFGATAPGTARWRWVDNDEHMWMRCSTGCCEVF
jgi:hypothetical protein